jgi:anti-sigma regulatory factor (Ser/Thr protein kinase)/CheY-like chemotaxis protein
MFHSLSTVTHRIRKDAILRYSGMVSLRRVLLVGEDPRVGEALDELLGQNEHSLQLVSKGAEALERLRGTAFDLVLAAVGGNGTDPSKLVRRLHAVRPDTKVIVTGDPNPVRALGVIRARAYGYVHTAICEPHAFEMVQQALDAVCWRDDIRVISARPEWITLDVQCKMEAADRTTHLVRELTADLEASVIEDIGSAFRELLLNGIEHGGKSNPHKRVRVSLLRVTDALMVQMRDPGKGFSMGKIEHAAVCNPEDSPTRHVEIRAEKGQRPGGFGILMARNLVDQLVYNERGNEVTFVKKLT